MTAPTVKRGRPKGTGLNDTPHLNAIAALVFQSQALKPTTAIRSLGISNPSTIRRLRDKFNKARQELLAQAQRESKSKLELAKSKTAKSAAKKPKAKTKADREQTAVPPSAQNSPVLETTSAATCALYKTIDPRIVEYNRPESSMKPNKTTRPKKTKAKTRPANRKSTIKAAAPATKSSPAKTAAPLDIAAKTEAPINLFSAWLSLNAQIITATARTQLQVLELAQRSTWFRETEQFQKQALNAWLCTLTPQVSIEDPLHLNPTPNPS